jgi:hypothetical protein
MGKPHSSRKHAVVQMAHYQTGHSVSGCMNHRLGEAVWGLGCDCFAF